MIAHIVLFTPKPAVTSGDARSFAQSIVGTLGRIQALERGFVGRAIDVDAGYQRSFGDKTYKYAAVLEFADRGDLVAYLNHPLHKELGALFWQYCESTVIVEVEAADARSADAVNVLLGSDA